MLTNHPIWAGLTILILLWYSTVTIYVAIRGARDVKSMLRSLKAAADRKDAKSTKR
jgi:hypothetical protein